MKTTNRRIITNGEIVHIINRGVDQRNIFLDKKDYFRFIHDIFEFNDKNPAFNAGKRLTSQQSIGLRNQYIERKKERQLIVDVLAFCLMPNHFHLLLKQLVDGGVIKFLRKLTIGYANYFNLKYQRSGTLFQGRYKAVTVNNERHFIYLPYYIHFNPLDLIMPEWRQGKIQNYQKAIRFLESYRWSSHLDYLGIKNFPSITQREFLLKVFNGSENYKKNIHNWMKKINIKDINKLTLE